MSIRGRRPAERALESLRAPDETGAEQRAWIVVRSAYSERAIAPRRKRRWRFALAPAAVSGVAAALALTPAGATVHRLIDKALGIPRVSSEVLSLPARGELLVSGAGGTWTVSKSGAKRRLGGWEQASWSPRGLYVAVGEGGELAAIDPKGAMQWMHLAPAIRYPRWASPSGYRVAYLSAGTLRVIAGDGSGDRLLARNVAAVAPAWRPGRAYQLAYYSDQPAVIVRDAETGHVLWSRRMASAAKALAWSGEGSRLLVVTDDAALVFDRSGREVARVASSIGQSRLEAAALSPDGHTLAILSGGDVTLIAVPDVKQSSRLVFTSAGLRQLAWSPDGQWLLVSWPAADQWIFIRATGRPRIVTISRIAEQFTTRTARHSFPQIDGWCCTTAGASSTSK